ncbi:hypothetical protein Pelo_7113 [Pelomyxa schiedti]|nr:hypothetical protein Pelo_7113 [Pelomyxa schiedti]
MLCSTPEDTVCWDFELFTCGCVVHPRIVHSSVYCEHCAEVPHRPDGIERSFQNSFHHQGFCKKCALQVYCVHFSYSTQKHFVSFTPTQHSSSNEQALKINCDKRILRKPTFLFPHT